MKEQEAVKVLINMALSHLGHGTDDFAKKSLDFYKLIKTHKDISFVVRDEYELVFSMHTTDDEDKTLGLYFYAWQTEPEREMWPIAKYEQYGFNERNAHLAFLMLIGGLQDKLRDRWQKQDFLEFG